MVPFLCPTEAHSLYRAVDPWQPSTPFARRRPRPHSGVAPVLNPVLRGWMNYFAVGHASECFGFVKDWVEKEDPAPFAASPEPTGLRLGAVE
jgi:Group II intron, maturase-specific domain